MLSPERAVHVSCHVLSMQCDAWLARAEAHIASVGWCVPHTQHVPSRMNTRRTIAVSQAWTHVSEHWHVYQVNLHLACPKHG